MTRKGEAQRFWTMSEIAYLRDSAGKMEILQICQQIERSFAAVTHKASELGISLRSRERQMVWCDHCAKWRSELDDNGRCPVCVTKELLDKTTTRHYAECGQLSHAQRIAYEERKAKQEEADEQRLLAREAARIRKATQRVREITGRNPRKGR